jgi:hypothetical protein
VPKIGGLIMRVFHDKGIGQQPGAVRWAELFMGLFWSNWKALS